MKIIGKITVVFMLFAMFAVSASAEEAAVKVTEVKGAKLGELKIGAKRAQRFEFTKVPEELNGLPAVSAPRGSHQKPGTTFSFKVDKPVTVYIFLDARASKRAQLEGWEATKLTANWTAFGKPYKDLVYKKDFPAGMITIPESPKGALPYEAVVKAK